jgi:hypothetical protein
VRLPHSGWASTHTVLDTVLFLLAEYDKKKYVWKLLYVYMLGYPVEFGHKQASDLIAAGK